jgi:hypothetical protein
MKVFKTLFGTLSITLGLFSQAQAQSFLTNGLVAFYPFDGNANDASGKGNNGIIYGATFQTNVAGRAIVLNVNGSSAAYVRIPRSASLEPADSISVTLWCKGVPGAGQNYGTMLRKADGCQPGYYIRTAGYRPDVTPTFKIDLPNPCVQGGVSAPFVPCTNTVWQHLAATYSRTNGWIATYLNGLQIGQTAFALSMQHSGDLFIGGATVGADDGGFDGLIDDVRVYNRALSAAEVQQLYQFEAGQAEVVLTEAVKPSFTNLVLGLTYQLQVSTDLSTWTDQGSGFTATNTSMAYPQYFDVPTWNKLFFRLQVAP